MSSARRLWLVARREWNQRVRTLAFRISTLISILIVGALILVPDMYGGGADAPTVGLVGESSPELPDLVRASGDQLGLSVEIHEFREGSAGRAALRSDDVSVLLVDQQQLVWKAETDDQLEAAVTSAVQVLQQREAIAELRLTPQEARRLLGAPDLPPTDRR